MSAGVSWLCLTSSGGKARDRQVVIRILEARLTPPWETLIILVNQARQPGARGIDQGMDPVPVGSCRSPSKVCFQNGHGRGMREDVRRLPWREHGERLLGQPSFVLGRGACAERGLIAHKEVRALKAGLELLSQPTFDAPYTILVEELWGPDSRCRSADTCGGSSPAQRRH